jgi:hypothetical protein
MKQRRGNHPKPACPYCGQPYTRKERMVNKFCWPHEARLRASVFATPEGLFADSEGD